MIKNYKDLVILSCNLIRLVEGVFQLFDDPNLQSGKLLKCMACEIDMSHNRVLNVEDPDYKKIPGVKQPKWFGNLKSILLGHLNREKHIKAAEKYSKEQSILRDKRKDIMDAIRYLAYFAIKSNLSFGNYPTLLATVNRYF